MSKPLLNLFLLIVIGTLVLACGEGNKKTVKISVSTTDTSAKEIKIYSLGVLGTNDLLAEGKFDSTGKASIEFSLSKTSFANFTIGNRFQFVSLYLEPGYNLEVVHDHKSKESIEFSGKGAIPNNYLNQSLRIYQDFEHTGGKYNWDLTPKEFMSRIDSVKNSFARFHNKYCDSTGLSKPISHLLELNNKLILTSVVQNFLMGNPIDKLSNEQATGPLLNMSNEIPFDDELLKYHMLSYENVLQSYLILEFIKLNENPNGDKKFQESYPIQMDGILTKDKKYPSKIRELLIAKNVQWNMSRMGLTPEVDSLFHKFISRYPASIYREPLQTQVNKWLVVSPGRDAPDFTGTTVDEKSLSLSDLKGKVVYIDVWATWCGPCREEFPFSNKLQKKFEGNNKIVFLFVSVDRDKGAWKKMVINDKAWKGVHINQRKISELYLIQGIPRYILIDAQGKIVKANAPRPSSNELEGEILELLKESNRKAKA